MKKNHILGDFFRGEEKKRENKERIRYRRNVTLLNGKSVSRVKSVFQEVKCFSMRDPVAPRMDPM